MKAYAKNTLMKSCDDALSGKYVEKKLRNRDHLQAQIGFT